MRTVLIIAAGLIALSAEAFAADVWYTVTDSNNNELVSGEMTFEGDQQLRLKNRLDGNFQDARKRVQLGDKPGADRTFIGACEALLGVLTGRTRTGGGQEYYGEVKLVRGDQLKLVFEGVVSRVCHGTAEHARPDNAASPVAIGIHGGYDCHDSEGVEEQYGANHALTGAECP